MQITVIEVNEVEGVWVESDIATYSITYEEEVQALALAFGIDPSWQEDAPLFLASKIGENTEAPAFLAEAENNPIL